MVAGEWASDDESDDGVRSRATVQSTLAPGSKGGGKAGEDCSKVCRCSNLKCRDF